MKLQLTAVLVAAFLISPPAVAQGAEPELEARIEAKVGPIRQDLAALKRDVEALKAVTFGVPKPMPAAALPATAQPVAAIPPGYGRWDTGPLAGTLFRLTPEPAAVPTPAVTTSPPTSGGCYTDPATGRTVCPYRR